MARPPINFAEKFSKFSEHWSPKIIAEVKRIGDIKAKGGYPFRSPSPKIWG